jgi:hypothetical protein
MHMPAYLLTLAALFPAVPSSLRSSPVHSPSPRCHRASRRHRSSPANFFALPVSPLFFSPARRNILPFLLTLPMLLITNSLKIPLKTQEKLVIIKFYLIILKESTTKLYSISSGSSKTETPGLDGIPNEVLKQLPIVTVKYITSIFHAITRCGFFPHYWKEAKVIMLQKPEKTHSDPNN